ncbi:N-terminal domain of NEFA-interacting nuclear protein NIP30-domain-containing protein [Rhexocercosporidium sp. MPI-PUGE-AT-0058]|nr:N-terminal domain of NEFA-interacting nuclear protein NIP30-domain-containing protein [Rhexocercosporidium sp. MPI-PUGE-AT-0058]
MSSGFISGGTTDAPLERSDEWLAAQKEIEANALRRAEQARQTDGKSLYETLEANKAAKQEAFEEANKLKNQFRGVDEDEAEWLDSVLESTRAEEDRVRKETAEGLALFRQQQELADKKARAGSDAAATEEGSPIVAEEESWVAGGRKRKRTKEKEGLKGVKLRRASTSTEAGRLAEPSSNHPKTEPQESQPQSQTKPPNPKPSISDNKKPSEPPKPASGLVNYGSDEDDDW